MAKFSVKKPLTVFVAVVAILVLGYVSFTGMTPDMLPNMDMPYVMVMTAYPGATPEKVETEVTRPLEQSMATLENIDSVSSTSASNYSLVSLQFTDDADLDTITIDILQKIEAVSGSWDEMIGTPNIMKLNPSIIPVYVAAVDMDDMDPAEISAFMDDALMNKLEGITGVASVSASGMLEQKINVLLSQEKIDRLNDKIVETLDGEFAKAQNELDAALGESESAKAQIESGKKQLESGQNLLSEQMTAGQGEISTRQMQVMQGKMQIYSQQATLYSQLETAQGTLEILIESQERILEIEEMDSMLQAEAEMLAGISEQLSTLTPLEESYKAQLQAIDEDTVLTDEEKEQRKQEITGSDEYEQTMAALAQIDAQLGTMLGITRAEVPEAILRNQENQFVVQAGLLVIDQSLGAMDLTRADIPESIAETSQGVAQLQAGIALLDETMKGLDEGSVQLSQAETELEKQKMSTMFQMSATSAQLIAGETALNSALMQAEQGTEQIDQAKEEAYAGADVTEMLTMNMISTMLTAQNFAMPAGYVSQDGEDYLVTVGDTFASIDEIKELLLFDMQMEGVEPVYMSDVAKVVFTDNSDSIYAKINGNNGVVLSFYKQSTHATADVSDNISARFGELSEEYPGLHFTSLMDQGQYIYSIVNSIIQNLLFGALFAAVILFLFLRDIKPTFITLCSIPISVLFAIVLMYFSGVTINMISLSGLAIAVGMLVDNSIVVIENIYRLRGEGNSAAKAAIAGATQVTGAIIASTLTNICVFAPIAFVQGFTRQLFTDMALTMAYSLLASLIVALTLVPALSSGMLRKFKKKDYRYFGRFTTRYQKTLSWILGKKILTLLVSVALLIGSAALLFSRGASFIPSMDMGELTVEYELPEDMEMRDAKELADTVVGRVEGIEEIETIGAMMSSGGMLSIIGSGMGSVGDPTSAMLYIKLRDDNTRDESEISNEIMERLAGLGIEPVVSGAAMMDMSAIGGSGISVEIFSNNLDDLQQTATDVAAVLESVEGTKNVSDGMEDNEPEIRFIVDKEKAMKEGLTVAQVYQEISAALLSETSSTRVTYGGDNYDVVVLSGAEEDLTPDFIENYKMTVTTRDGEEKQIALRSIATIEHTETLSAINRSDQRRYLTVTAEIADGYNVSLVAADAQKILDDRALPEGTTTQITGENQSISDSMNELGKMLLLGILLIYLIMVAQFQSLKSPFIVMFTIPLAFTGGFMALLITGMDFSIIAMIGLIMLCGIIVNNGIVLVDYINQLRQEGMPKREAILQAGTTRMRPILMTSLTTIMGLMVMALGVGDGGEMMQPLAVVSIGGMIFATALTMFVIPVLYDAFFRKDKLRRPNEEATALKVESIDEKRAADVKMEVDEEAASKTEEPS